MKSPKWGKEDFAFRNYPVKFIEVSKVESKCLPVESEN